jgi:hypothetical protein
MIRSQEMKLLLERFKALMRFLNSGLFLSIAKHSISANGLPSPFDDKQKFAIYRDFCIISTN